MSDVRELVVLEQAAVMLARASRDENFTDLALLVARLAAIVIANTPEVS